MSAVFSTGQVCKLSLIILLVFVLTPKLSAQNLFSEKVGVCDTSNFCMDCGDPKATCDQVILDGICSKIVNRYSLGDFKGSLTFQVLVDSTGFGCVLSHTDVNHTPLTAELIRYLNGFWWRTAKVNGKTVTASVNVVFRIANGGISSEIQRMDLAQLQPPGDPIVYNKKTIYTNPSLKTYEFTVWTKYNSPLPDNVSRTCTVDRSDTLWYASAEGITRFDGKNFNTINGSNSPFTGKVIGCIATDEGNNKWVYADDKIYKVVDGRWQVFDFDRSLTSGVTHILNNGSGKLMFTTNNGLVVVRKDRVVVLNKKSIPVLPSNQITYAYLDSKKRLWIGTSKGSIMFDKDLFITTFNNIDTPLKNMSISGVVEDEKGNLYFSLVNCNGTSDDDDDKEGIAILRTGGKWLHYNDKNSGMPSNRVNNMLYDKFEHVLWLGTDRSGIVRFNLKDGWENYHNANSPVPGHTIYQLVQDSKGTIYATTANGLLRLRKKSI